MPAARALSSPSGEAAEDNVEEREKFWVGRNYGLLTDHGGWTDRRGIWNSILDMEINVKFFWYILMYTWKCEVSIGHV